MKEIFLLKLGEIVLKGANKRQFESRLRQNVRRRMRGYVKIAVTSHATAHILAQSGFKLALIGTLQDDFAQF